MIREPGAGHKAFVMSDALATAFLPEPKDAGLAGADQRRFHEMVTGQLDFIWRCLRRMGIPAGDVDDAAQQVFLVASSKLSSIAPGSEQSFLFATASRIAANARRAVHRRDEAHRHLARHDPEHTPARRSSPISSARALMDRVLVEMPEELREAFVLFELEELSVSEVAEILAIPIGTVGSRLRRARDDFHERVRRLKAAAEFRKGGASAIRGASWRRPTPSSSEPCCDRCDRTPCPTRGAAILAGLGVAGAVVGTSSSAAGAKVAVKAGLLPWLSGLGAKWIAVGVVVGLVPAAGFAARQSRVESAPTGERAGVATAAAPPSEPRDEAALPDELGALPVVAPPRPASQGTSAAASLSDEVAAPCKSRVARSPGAIRLPPSPPSTATPGGFRRAGCRPKRRCCGSRLSCSGAIAPRRRPLPIASNPCTPRARTARAIRSLVGNP